jgi:hypothetical protein
MIVFNVKFFLLKLTSWIIVLENLTAAQVIEKFPTYIIKSKGPNREI